MNALFGIPMAGIMVALLALLGVALATVLYIGLTNRTMFRMGLRNLPRRGAQTVLVVTGLSLATLITTAAFVTGDTIDHSLTKDVYSLYGRSDIDITWNGERDFQRDSGATNQAQPQYLDGDALVAGLEGKFAHDPDIAAFLPALNHQSAVTNTSNGTAVPALELSGVDPERLDSVGGLQLVGGGTANISDLGANEVYLSERAADDLEAQAGDVLTVHIGPEGHSVTVAGIVRNEISSGVLGLSYSSVPGGMALPIDDLRSMIGLEGNEISALTVALAGDVRTTGELAEPATLRIDAYLSGEGAALVGEGSGLQAGTDTEVFASKLESIEESEKNGNLFVTFFLILGLFSMAAGVMLIFMIFVMLAAERRAEMGMSRAVGAQRGHLVKSFIVEGMAYSLLAGFIGVAAGVAASYGMTEGLLKTAGGDYFSLIEPKITGTSLVIGYSLGVVITFLTVVFASMKVSHVNIVSAIRDLPEEKLREARRKTRWLWVFASLPLLVIPPVGLWALLRKGFGLPWAWLLGPGGLALGALCIMLGKSTEMLFIFSLGVSLLPLSAAAIVHYYRVPNRPLWTVVGLVLGAYWMLPTATHDALFGKFDSDIEMFVLTGIMVVISFTLVIVFNARLLTGLFTGAATGRTGYVIAGGILAAAGGLIAAGYLAGSSGGGMGELGYLFGGLLVPVAGLAWAAARFPHLAPALKMAVAYPLSNRFRTGMTIAMFSLIVFSLTVFSVLLANYDTAFLGGDAQGNLDVVGTSASDEAAADVRQSLRDAGNPIADDIEAVGRTTLPASNQAVFQPGLEHAEITQYPVLAADGAFLGELEPALSAYANGYASPEAVLDAVRNNQQLAIVDQTVVGLGDGNDSYSWAAEGVTVEDDRFDAFELQVMDARTGAAQTVTVIGALKVGLSSSTVAGIYINEAAYTSLYGEPSYQRIYMRTVDGADAAKVARDVQSALATSGVEADSVKDLLDKSKAEATSFNRMFQAFMALGLLVGIAGLGVISFRSVVERRQQIGMLRAIGYQRATVTTTFLLESAFVAVMGILSGVVGGALIGRNLLTSDSFTNGADPSFAMPWAEVIIVIVASFAFSLLMTWWPSRGASRVPVAEALRYD